MPGLNQLTLIAQVVQDPVLRYSEEGYAISHLRVAVETPYVYGHGPKKELRFERLYMFVTTHGRGAEIMAGNIRKGMHLWMQGRLRYSEWIDDKGEKRCLYRMICERFQYLSGTAPETPISFNWVPEDTTIVGQIPTESSLPMPQEPVPAPGEMPRSTPSPSGSTTSP